MVNEISGLKREVKRAKLFEIQRLVRRIRQLANKKGTEAQLKKNQRKVERFEKEMEFLKDVEVAEIIRRIKSKKEDHNGHVDQELEVSQENIDLQKRATDRIINSTKLQEFLEKIAAEEKDSVEAEQGSRSADPALTRKKKQRKNVKDKTASCKSLASSEPQLKEEDEDNSSSDEKVLRQQKASKEKDTMNTRLTSGIDPDLEEFEDDNAYSPSSDFSESDEGEDSGDISSLGLKPKGLESCFVQTMSGLKKETSNGKSKQGKEKRKEANKKGKKNRKGQRARQQTWEKIHGKSAKHLHKKKTELSSKEGKEPKKKQKNEKTQHAIKRKDDNEMLHPSWEATKRRRLQESTKVEFTGEKIRFDDSE